MAYNPYTPTTSPAYVAHYAHNPSPSITSTSLPYFPALTQHSQALYASLSQQHSTSSDSQSHHHSEQQQPDHTTVTPAVASQTLRKLILYELCNANFDSAHRVALERIENQVVAFIECLFERAHAYSNLSNRSGPIASDLLLACDDFNIPLKDLSKLKRKHARNRRSSTSSLLPTLVPAPPRSPPPEVLSSDDEDTATIIPLTLRGIPNYFPALPPKHTYLRTPPSPPKKAALPSLEKKLKTAALVQESLKNLLIATEENVNQEDAELLGHIVNWEMGIHPRKRWKITNSHP
ncbi:hypothetical protein AMATHDRAFT_75529 [Amanita thiersii Skay4041]|uniref:Transcription initiation factor TFIID subunit 8 n=1 Tax=Amanita thiersii Skay4041 TaxID=703135 RepID=A0A2A9NS76_9AGAR|nr:hypothetical protein AMATHDRAFT_75529 [Amanita thiersii Skay4041]